MHEFSLLADLLRKIEAIRQQEQAEKVLAVKIRLGALAHISPQHFREHFTHAADQDPVLAGCRLEVSQASDETAPDAAAIRLLSIEVL